MVLSQNCVENPDKNKFILDRGHGHGNNVLAQLSGNSMSQHSRPAVIGCLRVLGFRCRVRQKAENQK